MKSVALILGLLSVTALADGNRVGNGGDVIQCPAKVQVLDLYEASQELQTFESHETTQEIVQKVLKNIERLNPNQGRQYLNRAAEFMDEVDFKDEAKLVNIRDSKHLFKPSDRECKLKQIAIRRKDASKNSKRFIISKSLWEQLDNKNQAALILHEIIYEHLYKLGEEDSVKARILVGYAFSKNALTENKRTYQTMIQDLKLPIYF